MNTDSNNPLKNMHCLLEWSDASTKQETWKKRKEQDQSVNFVQWDLKLTAFRGNYLN